MIGAHPQVRRVGETHFLYTLIQQPDASTMPPEVYWDLINHHFTSTGNRPVEEIIGRTQYSYDEFQKRFFRKQGKKQ
jgi:hypothetical protein